MKMNDSFKKFGKLFGGIQKNAYLCVIKKLIES